MSATAAASGVEAKREGAGPRTRRPGQRVTLLGHQSRRPTLAASVKAAGVKGRIATVTAGWQERELEDQELHTHLEGRSANLRLYERAERVFARDAALAALYHERQARLRELQQYYDVRLRHTMEACRVLDERSGAGAVLEAARGDAMDALRELDADHLDAIRGLHVEFDARLGFERHAEIRREREEVAAMIGECDAVAIAGGHVAVLLNRLQLFGVAEMIGAKPLFAWSAGAMVAGNRIVLYHDSPPQGPGNAEVLEFGLGLVDGLIALPHPGRRLLLDDTGRVSRFARRFAPDWCLAMDDGSAIRLEGGAWTSDGGVRRLLENGRVGLAGTS